MYGSNIIHFNALGNNIVVLNSMQAAKDLLDKRSAIYSDRPVSGITMLSELCGFDWSFGMKPYGPEWRDSRKAFQRVFHPNTVSRFRPREVVEARKLLCRLLRAPDDFMAHLRLTTGSLSLSIAYGIETQEENDPYIMHAERTLEAANAAMVPGAFLVDVFPAQWMPGASFKTKARIWKYSSLWTLNTPWEVVKRRMRA